MYQFQVWTSQTKRIRTPCGSIYCTMAFDDEMKPVKIFFLASHGATCLNVNLRAIATLCTRLFEEDHGIEDLIEDLRGHYCGIDHPDNKFLSCSDSIANYLDEIRKSYDGDGYFYTP